MPKKLPTVDQQAMSYIDETAAEVEQMSQLQLLEERHMRDRQNVERIRREMQAL